MAKIDYPIRPLGKWALRTVDTLLRPLAQPPMPLTPKRILLSQSAHHGDVVLATSLIAPLRRAGFEVGALVGSWAREVIAPYVSWTHTVDHWKLDRARKGCYYATKRRALKEIKQVGYDVAIDLRFHFPNLAPLLWQANIPWRIGFSSAGFSPLLTHPIPWNCRNSSALEAYRHLLTSLNLQGPLSPSLQPTEVSKRGHHILHLGSGDSRKEWPVSDWKALAHALDSPVHFTGKGKREASLIASLGIGENLANRLSWQALVDHVAGARVVICVDTAIAHIAASVGTPVIVLYRGEISPVWRPPGAYALATFDVDAILRIVQKL